MIKPQAREKGEKEGFDVGVAKTSFKATTKALAKNEGEGLAKETRRRPLTAKLTSKEVLAAAASDSAGCHRDSILSLASVKLNQRLLLSSCRDGAIKVWK